MPANVTIEFEKARLRYQDATSPEAKLEALLAMQSGAPAHKGGENLRRDISKKASLLRKEIEKKKNHEQKKGGTPGIAVKKEGIGQIVLVGLPSSGKSWLLNKLTGVDVEIAPYPFTTKKPVVGMMDFHSSKVQLVEVPALVKGSSEGKANGLQLLSIARNADAVILLARNRSEEQLLLQELGNVKIFLNEKKPAIEIQQSKFKGIAVVHKQNLKMKEALLHDFLHARGMYNVSVVLNEQLRDLLTVERVLDETIFYKPGITVDAFGEINFEELKQKIFQLLNKILVFTKKAGQPPDMNAPLALPAGTTVADAAKNLHKDFANFKYVKVWGSSKFPGQRVEHNFELRNGDIIEICA